MKQRGKLLLILSFLWSVLILALGSWWLYLIVNFGGRLDKLSKLDPNLQAMPNITSIVKWEGGTFLVLLILLSATLLYQYLKDQAKTRSLQTFFATMTHELKTPLASVRLQAEVIHDLLREKDDKRLFDLAERLIDDTQNLETQMDKVLQLSRLERGGVLNLVSVDLEEFIKNTFKKWGKNLKLDLKGSSHTIVADEFALELILRNLFENTRVHTNNNEIAIGINDRDGRVVLSYNDGGTFFGDKNRIGELFYKHESSKGTGIGLYLVKKLMDRMNGEFNIKANPDLTFSLTFPATGTARS